MTKQELEKKIRRQAGDLIYCWIYDSDIKDLGKNANAIVSKRNKQIAYLKALAYGTAGVKEDDIHGWIIDELANTYQKIKNPKTEQWETASPRLIMAALMLGETVKGKNWKQGIYGCKVGNTGVELSALTSGNVDYVNADREPYTGGGNVLGIPTFDLSVSDSKPATYSLVNADANLNNRYQLNPDTGLYELAAISDGTNTVDAAGNKLTADNQTLWDNITNCIGQIQGLVNTFAEFLSGITAAEALAPVQVEDGWVKSQENNSGKMSASTGLLLGGGLIASAFLLNNDKKKK